MKLSAIVVGIIFLVLWGFSTLPTIRVDWNFISFNLENPLHVVAAIEVFNFFGFALTIGWVILGFAILLLVVGVFT